MRVSRIFLAPYLKEQPLCRSVYYCWLKLTRWNVGVHEDYGGNLF